MPGRRTHPPIEIWHAPHIVGHANPAPATATASTSLPAPDGGIR